MYPTKRLANGALVPLGVVLVLSMLLTSSTVTEDVAAATGILEAFTSGDSKVTYNYTKDMDKSDYSIRLPKESNILDATMTLDGLAYYKSDVERSLSSSADWRNGLTSTDGGFPTLVYEQGNGLHLDMDQLAPFGPESTKSAGTSPRAAASGDFNADGRDDLVVANYNDNSVTVFTQSASKDLVKSSTLSTSTTPVKVEVGDLNNDGQDDFAVACYGGQAIDIFTSKATGGFNARKTISVGRYVIDLDIGDLNSDGMDDIAIGAYTYNGLMYRQESDGNFTKFFDYAINSGGQSGYSYYVKGVTVGDFNGDRRDDVTWTLAYNYPYNYEYSWMGFLRVHLQSSSGTFSSSYSSTRFTGTYPSWIDSGDINGDGRDDVVTTHYYTSKVRVFLAQAGGSFPDGTIVTGVTNPTIPCIADFDGDNYGDVVVGGVGKKFGFTKFEDGEISTSMKTWTSSNTVYGAAAGDFNSDGATDAVTANGAGDNIGIWLQRRYYSGSWVSKPAITQPLLIRYINFTPRYLPQRRQHQGLLLERRRVQLDRG